MMRERVELENALHDIQTQLEQAKQVTACVPTACPNSPNSLPVEIVCM